MGERLTMAIIITIKINDPEFLADYEDVHPDIIRDDFRDNSHSILNNLAELPEISVQKCQEREKDVS
ncbi:MAG: hypothetical protein JRJ78_13940 [Deltaproteobacteria bacterium]|nr:hypothetical protein [Deltaproteobacteria bacterium]